MMLGNRKIQFNRKAGSYVLVIPPVWVRDQGIQPSEVLSLEARDGELIIKKKLGVGNAAFS